MAKLIDKVTCQKQSHFRLIWKEAEFKIIVRWL
jgi:hypothetical protein